MNKDNHVFLMAALLFGAWIYKKKIDQAAAPALTVQSNAIMPDASTVSDTVVLQMRQQQAVNLDVLDNPSPTNRPTPGALIRQTSNEEETMFAGSSLG